ncbi:MAG: hypothetical protein U0836_06120 [Pirellulales bacterium]
MEPAIHRIRLDRVTIFEITESELEALERGSPESIFLNLCVGTTSIGISFFIALSTTSIPDTPTFCVFVLATLVSLLSGLTFGLLWWQPQIAARGRETNPWKNSAGGRARNEPQSRGR